MDHYIYFDQSSSSHSSDSFEFLFQEMENEFRIINSHVEAEWKEMIDVLDYKLTNSHMDENEYQSQVQKYKELMKDYCERLFKGHKEKFDAKFQALIEREKCSSHDYSNFEKIEENVEDNPILRNDFDDPTHPPNHDLHLEISPNPSEPNLTLSDQPSVDKYSCFEELIFENPLEENDFIMDNYPLDPLDFDSRGNLEEFDLDLDNQMIEGEEIQFADLIPNLFVKNNDSKIEDFSLELLDLESHLDFNKSLIKDEDLLFDDLILNHPSSGNDSLMDDLMEIDVMKNKDIFEDSPSLPLGFPSLKVELLASWSKEIYGSELQIPYLAPLMDECEFSPSPPKFDHSFDFNSLIFDESPSYSFDQTFEFNSYILDFVDAPPLIFFELFVHQFFRHSGITLHHQLVSLTKISVGVSDLYTFSIFSILRNSACEPDLFVRFSTFHLYIPSFVFISLFQKYKTKYKNITKFNKNSKIRYLFDTEIPRLFSVSTSICFRHQDLLFDLIAQILT